MKRYETVTIKYKRNEYVTMQEVLRLKRASTIILSAYHDEPNTAISLMSSAFDKCKREHQEQIAVTKALQEAFKSVSCNGIVTESPSKRNEPVTESPKRNGFVTGSDFRVKYKDKVYDVKSDKNGDYIIDVLQMKRIVREGKVVE